MHRIWMDSMQHSAKVVEGLDVVDKIALSEQDGRINRLKKQKIQSMTVELFGETYPEPEKC